MFSVMAAQEIPKPKNWQDFQRGCVVLFQAELKDPHAQEYGRHDQKQQGIDILGRRNGDPTRLVGVQCRRYVEPLKYVDMLKDCREALEIKAGLKEIIFATTAPSDTKATDAVLEVERLMRSEGHDLTVVLYSWSDLELKICQHPPALAFFFPVAVASTAQQNVRIDATALTAAVAEAGGLTGVQIKDKLSTTAKVAAALIKHGHLKSVTVINPVNRCPIIVVPVAEVERFGREFVSLFALARQQRRHHMAVKKELDAASVKPAMDSGNIGATFYRRGDLATAKIFTSTLKLQT